MTCSSSLLVAKQPVELHNEAAISKLSEVRNIFPGLASRLEALLLGRILIACAPVAPFQPC